MARPKRIDLPFTLYHVMSRTISGELAFKGPGDYRKFFHYLGEYARLFDFRVHAFCLLPNHFHLLLECGRNTALSELMRRLLTAYTIYFNKRHGRHGHLFQGRFKSLVVDKADYLLPLSSYIHSNPSRLKRAVDPETYEWSSLHYYLKGGEPVFLYTGEILGWFHGDRKEYARFVKDGLNEQTKPAIIGQRYIGNEPFVRRLKQRLEQREKKVKPSETLEKREKDTCRKEEERRAGLILLLVAEEYDYPPEILLQGQRRRGSLGQARTVLANILRDYLPWSCRVIAEFMKLKDYTTIYHHQERLRENKHLIAAYRKIVRMLDQNS